VNLALLPLLALQTAPATPTVPPALSPTQQRLAQCIQTSSQDPQAAIELANAWIAEGGGRPARHCLGIGFFDSGQFRSAETVFVDAGTGANGTPDPAAAQLWALAGAAALAQGEASTARDYLNFAIGEGNLTGLALATAHADLAKARASLDDMAGARTSVDEALRLVPDEGAFWIVSAIIARRMRDFVRAQADIQQAAALLPREPEVALEAGNIAYMVGNDVAARRSWESVLAIAPTGPVADAARRRLVDLREEARQDAANPPR
jgi:tetratricopeptide (TPR) repeat protein